jgi:hypothetical protein
MRRWRVIKREKDVPEALGLFRTVKEAEDFLISYKISFGTQPRHTFLEVLCEYRDLSNVEYLAWWLHRYMRKN